MKISYEEAIGNLQKMFSGVDKEVIQTILAMHSNYCRSRFKYKIYIVT